MQKEPHAPSVSRSRRASLRRSRLGVPLVALVALALTAAPAPALAQGSTDVAAARQLATQGVEAYNAGKYAEALDLASRAEQLLHAPTHLLMIGRAQVGLGQLVAAKETFLKLGREPVDAKTSPGFKRAIAEGKDDLAQIEPRIASLQISIEGGAGKKYTLKMDDQPVSTALVGVYRPVDPGKHDLALFPVGQSPIKATIELKDGEKKEIKLTIPAASTTPGAPLDPVDNPDAHGPAVPPGKDKDDGKPGFFTPLRGVGFGALALGAGGIGVGAVFLAKGGSQQSSADALADSCGKHCTSSQQLQITTQDQDAATSKTIATAALIGGGVALAAGVVLIIVGKPKPKPPAAFVTPWFSGDAIGVRGAF